MSKNLAAVEKLVEAWTYPILSLDFMSFPACRQRRESSSSCLLTSEYFNIYSSVEHAPCITSIAVGLFNNVYRQVCQRSYSHLQVQEVDMSCIQASLDNGESLHELDSLARQTNELDRKALIDWGGFSGFSAINVKMLPSAFPPPAP